MNKEEQKPAGKYDDIINLPHHVSTTRHPMPMASRAAQFAAFAALSGHDDAIAETARLSAARMDQPAEPSEYPQGEYLQGED